MAFLYNISILVYQLLIRISAPFNKKAGLWVKGRKNIWKNLSEKINPSEKKIWIHVSSLGEFEQGRPLIEGIKKKYPDIKILLTFFSPSGYEIRKNYENADYIFYLPSDTLNNAKKFIELTKPFLVVFVKYDFWFNYISCIAEKKIPIVFISSIFRKNQHFFKWYGGWFRKHLKKINHFFVQDISSENLLKGIGINQVTACGDTRFDRVYSITQNVKPFPDIQNFCGDSTIFIAGSTWPPDENILIPFINSGKTNYKFIIAPHLVDKAHISSITEKIKVPYILYSEISAKDFSDKNVLVIDCIGILSNVYQYAHIAYIGGGFGVSIHNIQEPATFGMPIIFGPKHTKFREAVELIKEGGAFCINNENEFYDIIKKLENTNVLKASSEISKKYIQKNIGATKIILENISKYFV
ncbi:MAG TPA: glycosyltransferase N-terminal domain-containing protein [Bacteroidales bacterium]|nr:glycosyltransferase N-terminal domain-containing protein [Bacteroidales bacterium]HPS16838.1 glycosyltransferase N-terminal domain-containing protein [Bacteroidales bacterium]